MAPCTSGAGGELSQINFFVLCFMKIAPNLNPDDFLFSFQTVSQIAGLWRLDLFNEDSKLMFAIAPPDGIEQYEAELQMLHTFIAMMMFMSLVLSSMLNMMRRQGLSEAVGGGGGERGGNLSTITSSRRGLSRDVINSLPLKCYTVGTPSSGGGRYGDTDSLENECCPICLVDFTDGDEIRTLPCGHFYHGECVDSWLSDCTTCPTCRENIDNTTILRVDEEATITTTPTIDAASNDFLTQPQFFPSWPFVWGFGNGERRQNRWSGVPSSADDTDIGIRHDNNERLNNVRDELTSWQRLPDIRGFFATRGHFREAVQTAEEAGIGQESVELVEI
jgi:hypothetical protein